MNDRQHSYQLTVIWTGNKGAGTTHYNAYERSHTIQGHLKPSIPGSSDPSFRGDPKRYNPEEMLLASVSSCHMLWYLHLCSEAGVVVTDYFDQATGTMAETANGASKFTEITLHPVVTVTDSAMFEIAHKIHQQANTMCFIASSVNFPIYHQPTCQVSDKN